MANAARHPRRDHTHPANQTGKTETRKPAKVSNTRSVAIETTNSEACTKSAGNRLSRSHVSTNSDDGGATGEQVILEPIGVEFVQYPDLYLDLGEWTLEDSSVLYTLDVFFDCAATLGQVQQAEDGTLTWEQGGPPAGVGVEAGGEDCDEPIEPLPEIFDHQPGRTGTVDIELDFEGSRCQFTIGDDFSQEFEALQKGE